MNFNYSDILSTEQFDFDSWPLLLQSKTSKRVSIFGVGFGLSLEGICPIRFLVPYDYTFKLSGIKLFV
jgi:hypothetical protein